LIGKGRKVSKLEQLQRVVENPCIKKKEEIIVRAIDNFLYDEKDGTVLRHVVSAAQEEMANATIDDVLLFIRGSERIDNVSAHLGYTVNLSFTEMGFKPQFMTINNNLYFLSLILLILQFFVSFFVMYDFLPKSLISLLLSYNLLFGSFSF
jgi:hypothetical protein